MRATHARRTLSAVAVLSCAVVAAACGAKPPPPPEPPPATVHEEPPPPPPPPPACKALEDKCTADATTRAKIASSKLSFAPPAGWTYAQGDDGSLAISGGSVIGVIHYDASDAKAEAGARDAALASIAATLHLTIPKKKVHWKAKPHVVDAPALKVSVWQVHGATRDGAAGAMLAFVTKLDSGDAIVGAAFVPSDDKSGADEAILKALGSVAATDEGGGGAAP